MFSRRSRAALALPLFCMVLWAARKPGDPLKPGFNLFSRQDDVQVGQENAKQVLKQYEVVSNAFLQDYVRKMGEKLAAAPEATASGFTFTFTVLHVDEVNAFALPGGPMFIYTGLLKATANEAQLAGVMGHEMSHVILRHGTHEATKANAIQLLTGGLGALIGGGGDSTLAKMTTAGLGLAGNSFLLKFSRDAETEADALGSHLMAECGYNPVEMAKFFETLNRSGGQQLQILSDHPNPGNREVAIDAEVRTLPPRKYDADTGLFARVRREVAALPPPRKKAAESAVGPGSSVPPAGAGGGAGGDWPRYQGRGFAIQYPNGWQASGEPGASEVTLAPRDGVVTKDGAPQVGFGAVTGEFQPRGGRGDLASATSDLIEQLRGRNAGIEIARPPQRMALTTGLQAMTTTLRGASPFGGGEVDTLITVRRGEVLWYIVFAAPEADQPRVAATFERMLGSLAFM